MKLASLKHGRDGKLVVVSRDLSLAVAVPEIANTLQQALDNWVAISPRLQAVSTALNAMTAQTDNVNRQVEAHPATTSQSSQLQTFAFDPTRCASPLPRA
ncbi:MAG: hypothetical protein ACPG47_08740, partial [Leucothrix sp.]